MGKFFLIGLSLVSLLSFSAYAHGPYVDADEKLSHASQCAQWLQNFEGLVGKDTVFSELRPTRKIDGPLYYEARGVPKSAKWRLVEPGEVFRHYVGDLTALNAVVQSSELRSGNRPYLEGGGNSIFVFKDLTGIFLTTPSHSSHFVDAGSSLYVDFSLPPGTKVLELRDGITLLPGPPSNASWLLAEYEKWKKDPLSVDQSLIAEMKRMDQAGVLVPRRQKIHILGHSPLVRQ